jgi:uncharacterized metal-binding protein YceD (DUF177 family)
MKVHIRQIPAEGLHLEGEDDCPIPELERDEARCAGPLRYSLDLGISEGSLWAKGVLVQPVELRCVNCLETFMYELRVPDFAMQLDLTGPELIDLTPLIREDILLNLPAHPHCDRDGGKDCPGPREIAPLEPETEAKREHDWEALDKLKLKS